MKKKRKKMETQLMYDPVSGTLSNTTGTIVNTPSGYTSLAGIEAETKATLKRHQSIIAHENEICSALKNVLDAINLMKESTAKALDLMEATQIPIKGE